MNSGFEKRLQELPMREIPGQWKAQIVAVAQPQPAWWREWLWPCPRAWAGLAAAWLVILGMNLAAGKNPSRPGTATLAFSRQELLELRQQQQMLAKLISPGEAAETEPPRQVPAPRSERRITVIAI